MKHLFTSIFLTTMLLACSEQKNKPQHKTVPGIQQPEEVSNIPYHEFQPDTASGITLKGFDVEASYQINSLYFLTGNYEYPDGKIVYPNTETDWGDRLLVIDKQHKIRFQSKGTGDLYLFEPHFYKNAQNDKIFIVCQAAFEYYCGGDVFLFEKQKIQFLGTIDVSGKDMETSLIDIVQINENKKETVFSFNTDSLIFNPGGEKEALIKNNNLRYSYDGKRFKFVR
ncbi:hypothetical protein [Fluviicola sp.]|uniref:hypothetical protein n=1 Tax=Fluviicola sp. TaxID=1917219 RepID=UPI0026055CE3|nr:hypothetical protein [Fluviicola sp.]